LPAEDRRRTRKPEEASMPRRNPKTKAAPAAEARPVTAESSALQILRENVRMQLEILRRDAWERHQTLRAELNALPPAPASFEDPLDDL
jgi:hypothetical protein